MIKAENYGKITENYRKFPKFTGKFPKNPKIYRRASRGDGGGLPIFSMTGGFWLTPPPLAMSGASPVHDQTNQKVGVRCTLYIVHPNRNQNNRQENINSQIAQIIYYLPFITNSLLSAKSFCRKVVCS